MNHVTPVIRMALAVVLLAVTGCGGGGRKTLTVFADTSLTGTFGSLGRTFEATHPGVAVRFDFGGSDALARRIAGRARADLFAAAGEAAMRASGAPNARVFARDSLQIAVPKGNPAHIANLKDLAAPGVTVALCAETAPCGTGAGIALADAGVTVTPASRERDAAAALTKVKLGEADAALVYRTDVRAAAGPVEGPVEGAVEGPVEGVDVPEAARAALDYLVATVPGTEHISLTREFVDLVLSNEGRRVLAGAGFTPVTG